MIYPALGLASGTVRVVPYDARWPDLYAAEAARIADVLDTAGVSVELEHIGSTAVPGLAAKPIIDILAGRPVDTPRAAVIAAIEAADYEYRGEQEIPGRDFFRRGEPRSWHLHLTEIDSEFWRQHRAFRDYIRANPAAAQEYQRVKLELARRFPFDRPSYIDGKTEFVTGILRLAGAPCRTS